jgi:hypothetical protein
MLTLEQMAGPTFRPTPSQPYLVRFEHIFEKGEDATLSLPIKIVLQVNINVQFVIEFFGEILNTVKVLLFVVTNFRGFYKMH